MTLRECYDQMNGSYDDAKARLMMDSMIERFLQKFLEDKTMEDLRRAVASGDVPLSFRQAHTLKGVAANLAFTGLQKAASDLTEQLRPRQRRLIPGSWPRWSRLIERLWRRSTPIKQESKRSAEWSKMFSL